MRFKRTGAKRLSGQAFAQLACHAAHHCSMLQPGKRAFKGLTNYAMALLHALLHASCRHTHVLVCRRPSMLL